MKLNILTTATVLTVAGALMAQPAKAKFTSGATPGTAASGDLILAFSDATTTDKGSTIDFEVDLGQLSLYSTATMSKSIINIDADLSFDYGNGYFSNGDIKFGILGLTNNGAASNGVKGGSLLVSDPSSTAYPTIGTATLAQDNTNANPIYAPNADTTNVPTDGMAANSYDVKAVSGAAFDKVETKDGFGSSTVAFDGSTTPDLYLDIEQPGTSSFAKDTSAELANGGYFDITQGGEVEFVLPGNDDVPEPSTYALLAAGGALLVWQLRRKSVSNL